MKIKWFGKPQDHDDPAAVSYLSLIFAPQEAKNIASALETAEMAEFAAKDIFRASGLSVLDVGNSHVEKDRTTIILNENFLLCCCTETKRMPG